MVGAPTLRAAAAIVNRKEGGDYTTFLNIVHVPAKLGNEERLARVTGLWMTFFKALDNSYDPTFDTREKPSLIDAPAGNGNRSESERNARLLEKSTHYWHLRALDENATFAMRMFVQLHYRESRQPRQLRRLAISEGLVPDRIERILVRIAFQ